MIKLNFYKFSLENKKNELQVLNYFNGETDFLDVLEEYCAETFQNIHRYIDKTGRKRSFSLSGPVKRDENQRCISGIFEPAFTGDKFKVKDGDTNNLKYRASSKDLQSREIFSLMYVPKNSKYAYLCVEQKANHSIKTVFQNTLDKFLKKSGYSDINLKIENAPNQRFLKKMIYEGSLKEIRLIKEDPILVDGVMSFVALNNVRVDQNEQVLKFSKGTNTQILQQQLLDVFLTNYSDFEKISFFRKIEEYDEISFVMNSGGMTKTFYVKDRSKIKSSIDISNLVRVENDEILIEDLVKASFICIRNIQSSLIDGISDVA